MIVTSRTDKPLSAPSGAWPNNNPFFLLLGQELTENIAFAKMQSELNGFQKSDSGEKSGAKYNYSLTIKDVVSLKMSDTGSNKIKCSINMDISADATAGEGGPCAISAAADGF